ncbi:hypothetical protein L593_10010 [Salinarchaeum sp. Harcht-Bsk1]|uniref:DUF7344 domain-containing protein n=1 Tax=Salinarchaeum sp. Harcht-Bsk1 TaxID=1333523 RepID=UPI0003423DB7|nr:hypothetical protein [Salinarchaeum sp. Harcht-Bsk1]AGN01947.1 hypothetical protein L593_10010 [Salinarchaeum sp. Harcht-Bsk1]
MIQSPTDSTDTVTSAADLPPDDRHRLLAAERRRVALEVLTDWTEPVDLESLAAAVATREGDDVGADGTNVEHVAITLHHAHLPMMADFGVIRYDSEATRVEACPREHES